MQTFGLWGSIVGLALAVMSAIVAPTIYHQDKTLRYLLTAALVLGAAGVALHWVF